MSLLTLNDDTMSMVLVKLVDSHEKKNMWGELGESLLSLASAKSWESDKPWETLYFQRYTDKRFGDNRMFPPVQFAYRIPKFGMYRKWFVQLIIGYKKEREYVISLISVYNNVVIPLHESEYLKSSSRLTIDRPYDDVTRFNKAFLAKIERRKINALILYWRELRPRIQSNKEVALHAVTYGLPLSFTEFEDNEDIVIEAIRHRPQDIQSATEHLQNDGLFLRRVLTVNPNVLQFLDITAQEDVVSVL